MDDTLWHKDAIIYELRVRSYSDSDSDGMGDFRGMTQRLDYLQELGVTTLWILPFYPSPFRDDGYDISDYTSIHPSFGTLPDFRTFLREAHKRGLKVITELVLNHTSDEHPWFQRARRAKPGTRWRDFYVWSATPDRYKDSRVIFKDFETSNWTWDPVAKSYYWHRFYAHQPDLNYDNPEVRRAMFRVVDFWFKLGVDGLRLDAVPYLYEREGTSCENLPETHSFLKDLRRHVDRKFRDRILIAEANQWPEDAVAYFGEDDECHMAFHFPIMPRMFMAIHMEDRYPIIDIMEQTPKIGAISQWALFLRNHDELTLEMVTDEERDYMYRVYAMDPRARINLGIRRRLAPLLGNNRRKIELMNGLLLSLPGTPVLYYGDEIGMGDNIYLGDRNSVRTPMQWSNDKNAGFSKANPQKLYLPITLDPEYHYEAVNVEAQQNNPHSLLWWMKRLIALRKKYKAFGRGTLQFLSPNNPKVLAFIRQYQNETILAVANLSRYVQFMELDLSTYKGMVPVELFGKTDFPSIGELPYFLTLGPHSFYWFSLERRSDQPQGLAASTEEKPALEVSGDWTAVFKGRNKPVLDELLPAYLMKKRWFAGRDRQVKGAKVFDVVPLAKPTDAARLALINVDYANANPEMYVLPVIWLPEDPAKPLPEKAMDFAIARLSVKEKNQTRTGWLCDAIADNRFADALLEGVRRRRQYSGSLGRVTNVPHGILRSSQNGPKLDPALTLTEQTNTSITFGDKLILKLFRRFEEGPNPDLEIGRFLTEKAGYANAPPVVGEINYKHRNGWSATLAVLHSFVPSQTDAWRLTLDELDRFLQRALVNDSVGLGETIRNKSVLQLAQEKPPDLVRSMIGSYWELAGLLGQRTAEMHRSLALLKEDPAFAPEPFSPFYQKSIYQSMRGSSAQALQLLKKKLSQLPSSIRPDAETVIGHEPKLNRIFENVRDQRINAERIRVHGDFHLGQLLYTGRDFMVIDFEGEPERSISERRLKRCPLRDVAGMFYSFEGAAQAALELQSAEGGVPAEKLARLSEWTRVWVRWISAEYLRSYVSYTADSGFLPKSTTDFETLVRAFVLERAMRELKRELENDPPQPLLPLRGILNLLEGGV